MSETSAFQEPNEISLLPMRYHASFKTIARLSNFPPAYLLSHMRNQSCEGLIYPLAQRLNPGWDDVVDEPMSDGFGSAGVDQPAIHQVEQAREHHLLSHYFGEVQVC